MTTLPHKVTRICWNSNHWTAPSGKDGKSKNKRSFENEQNFGFEEWNLDFSKIIDGYIYGYVPAAATNRLPTNYDPIFNLSLYTIQNQKNRNQRWWIGTIFEVEIVNTRHSKQIYEIYKKKGWLKERFEQLENLNTQYKHLSHTFAEHFFNIRYKLQNINILETPIPFKHKDAVVKSNYYNFLDFSHMPDQPLSTNLNESTSPSEGYYRKSSSKEEIFIHKLHEIVYKQLKVEEEKKFNSHEFIKELLLKNNTRVDLAVKSKEGKYRLYEIKIASNLREALRQSVGQLLEYAFIIDYLNIEQLIIVSTFDIEDEHHKSEQEFLALLKQKFNIPINYKFIPLQNT